MIIYIKKFGQTLSSRPDGREAVLAFQPTLKEIKTDEEVVLDFEGVSVMGPGWADEFVTHIIKNYGERVTMKNFDNPGIKITLDFLKRLKEGKV